MPTGQAQRRQHTPEQLAARAAFPRDFRAWRTKVGLSRPAVAALVGLGKSTVRQWEDGHAVPSEASLQILIDKGYDGARPS